MRTILVIIQLLFFSFLFSQSTMYVDNSYLNFRTDSNTNSGVIQQLYKGNEVKVLHKGGEWSKISYGNKVGYVAHKYLSSTKPITKTTPVETKVLVCGSKSSYAYHSHKCQGLKRCRSDVYEMTKSNARSNGYKACKFCY